MTLLGRWVTLLGVVTLGVVEVGARMIYSVSTEPRPVVLPVADVQTSPDIHAPVKDGATYEITFYSHGCIMPFRGPEGHARRAANGRWPIADVTVAADTRLHPFGTELLVEGIGFRTVGDRGRAIKGKKLDLFVDSCREARKHGRQWRRVIVVPEETTREAGAR